MKYTTGRQLAVAENIVQNYICTRVKSVGFKTVSYLELISDNQPLSLRSRNPHNFDNLPFL